MATFFCCLKLNACFSAERAEWGGEKLKLNVGDSQSIQVLFLLFLKFNIEAKCVKRNSAIKQVCTGLGLGRFRV